MVYDVVVVFRLRGLYYLVLIAIFGFLGAVRAYYNWKTDQERRAIYRRKQRQEAEQAHLTNLDPQVPSLPPTARSRSTRSEK